MTAVPSPAAAGAIPAATYPDGAPARRRRAPLVLALAAAALWLTAALLRWWAAPAHARLDADYAAQVQYAAELRSRASAQLPVVHTRSVVRRSDQTLAHGARHSVIQGEARWTTSSGEVIFEVLAIYGVDRRSRRHLGGFGDQERSGQYLLPPHAEPRAYRLWDPLYAGPVGVGFSHASQVRGLAVYVYDTLADDIDESAGYAALPEVPERYRVRTTGRGRLWVEPVSGIVVDHHDAGASHFVDVRTGQRVGAPMNRWQQRYTPETVAAQLQRAGAMRWRMRALESGLPLGLAAAGLLAAAMAWRLRRAR